MGQVFNVILPYGTAAVQQKGDTLALAHACHMMPAPARTPPVEVGVLFRGGQNCALEVPTQSGKNILVTYASAVEVRRPFCGSSWTDNVSIRRSSEFTWEHMTFR
jgi:hypothetical protein